MKEYKNRYDAYKDLRLILHVWLDEHDEMSPDEDDAWKMVKHSCEKLLEVE